MPFPGYHQHRKYLLRDDMKRYMMQPIMNVIQKLETYRLEQRISQEDLAKQLGVAFSTVNRWLNGKSKPNKIQEYHIKKLVFLKKK